jgi:Ni,Fe-hydrogenase III large subunit
MKGVELLDADLTTLAGDAGVLAQQGGRMQMAYAWRAPNGLELRYMMTGAARRPFQMWRASCPTQEAPSLTERFPLLGWYEREITDLFGVRFVGHPEPKRLVLHDGVAAGAAPFATDYTTTAKLRLERDESAMPDLEGPDVQRLPWGPVRADVVESAEFVFYYVGEHILHLHTQLFFKHRGMEKRFEGETAIGGVIIAERVSGVGSFAHALAYCQAIEAAADAAVPPRALVLRSVLAELERIYNHLHYLGHLADTTTLKVAAAEGKLLEERAKQINGRLSGSRFLRGLLTPGGLRRDLTPGDELVRALEKLRRQTRAYVENLERTGSYLDRLITTGKLDRQTAFDQGATGPVERASGLDRDLRRDHPYAAYDQLPLTIPARSEGDAHARALVRSAELEASFAFIFEALRRLPTGPVATPCIAPPLSEGLGWAETPRGSLYYAVHVGADGRLTRVKIKSPSFSNWRVFPYTVHDTNMMDYAINEASFGLTIAGCDR